MKKILTFALCLMIFQANFAQAPGTITTVEGVFGGRINAITGGKLAGSALSDSFRIFVATESANSIFYSVGHFPTLGTASVDSFRVLPSANPTAAYGSSIQKLLYNKSSDVLYFIANGNIYSTTVSASSATLEASGGFIDMAFDSTYFYALSASGTDNTIKKYNYNASGHLVGASVNYNFIGGSYTSFVKGKDDKLYMFRRGTDPQAMQFGGSFASGIDLTTTVTDAMNSLTSSYSWDAMGVYTDGSVYVGGTNGGTNPFKYVANAASFNPATYTTVATGISGTSGANIEFRAGLLTNYYVYFGSAYSDAKGAASTWTSFGNTGLETHSNDGDIKFFQEHLATGGILLLTTDAGLGWTKNSGATIADINYGILATQVKDFDMNSAKTFGWLAAKDGIRYVNNYNTATKAWTKSIWPMGDGSPYYSAEMVGNDSTTAYVGNLRIYKTSDKGVSWSRVFTPENAPYYFPQVGVRAEAIAVSDSLNNIVMAGFYNQNAGQLGGVFYSMDGGTNWTQLLINASSFGQDVNVNDIELTTDSGKVVAYIGIDYINSTVRGMYKAQWDGASWTVRREEIYSSSTSQFSVTDIIIPNKDTIAAVGSFYNPVLARTYPIYFNISRSVFNSWTSTVVDTTRKGSYTACAWNNDTLFYGYSNKIYYDIISFHSSSTSRVGEALYAAVDAGTEINVLYYDELLLGSSVGFSSVRGASTVYTEPIIPTISISTSTTSICANTNVTFTASTVNAGSNPVFQWNKNNAFVGSGSAITFMPGTLNNNDIITCILTANNNNVTSNAITMTVKQSPFLSPITGTLVSCQLGLSNVLRNSTSGGVWSSTNSSVATISSVGRITAVSNGTTNISYTVTGSNGCSNSMTSVYRVSTIPTPTPITGATSVCVGQQTLLNNSTSGGIWTSIAGRASISSNGLVTGTSAGNATIKYTISNADGCSNYINYSLTVNAVPGVPSITYAAGSTVNPQTGAPSGGYCVGRTFGIAGIPAGGSWSTTGCISVTSAGIATITTAGAGSLTYTYTNANGCASSRTISGTGYVCAARNAPINSETITTHSFKVYPNPARTSVNISFDNNKGGETIVITDMMGKQVKQLTATLGSNVIDISNLTKGLYIVSSMIDNEIQTQKLIVE